MTNQQTKKETEKVEWDWTKTQNTGYYDGRPVSISQSTRTIELNEMTIPQTEKVECKKECTHTADFDCPCKDIECDCQKCHKPEGVGEWEKDRLSKCLDHYIGTTMSKSKGYAIKKIVKDLLLQEKAKWKEKIDGMEKTPMEDEDEKWAIHYKGYNEAIKDILELLS